MRRSKRKQTKVNAVVAEINEEQAKAQAKEKLVSADKSRIEKEAAVIAVEKAKCEEELSLALPALIAASNAASSITSADTANWKSMASKKDTGNTAKWLADAVSILLYEKVRNDIDIKPTKPTTKAEEEYMLMVHTWDVGKKVLTDSDLKKKLSMRADKKYASLINDEILELVEPYTKLLENFLSYQNVKTQSESNLPLREWVKQIELFSLNTRSIKPKQAALEQQESKLSDAMNKLNAAQAVLDEINRKITVLNENLRVNKQEADELDADYREQMKKIKKANNLIGSLADERERWKEGAEDISRLKNDLVGNAGLATAFISYCGPFSSIYRDRIARDRFIRLLSEQKIPFSANIYEKLVEFLVDEATIGQWNLDGLPKDTLSIQNGIMVEASERYPLMIDPQGQGAFWIKNKYKGPSKDNTRKQSNHSQPERGKEGQRRSQLLHPRGRRFSSSRASPKKSTLRSIPCSRSNTSGQANRSSRSCSATRQSTSTQTSSCSSLASSATLASPQS